jgi:hypothetical protein
MARYRPAADRVARTSTSPLSLHRRPVVLGG